MGVYAALSFGQMAGLFLTSATLAVVTYLASRHLHGVSVIIVDLYEEAQLLFLRLLFAVSCTPQCRSSRLRYESLMAIDCYLNNYQLQPLGRIMNRFSKGTLATIEAMTWLLMWHPDVDNLDNS